MDVNILAALIGAVGAGTVAGLGFAIKSVFTSFFRLKKAVETLKQALETEKELNQELRLAASVQTQVADAVKRALGGPNVS